LGDSGFGDPWGGSSSKSNNSDRADDLFAGKSDPWSGTNGAASKTNGHDPWAPKSNEPSGANSTNPWFGSSKNAANGNGASADPWGASNGNGHEKLDDFDLFTSNRAQQTPVNDPFGDFLAADTAAKTTGSSTNPWGGSSDSSKPTFDPFASASTTSTASSATSNKPLPTSTSSSAIRKTPESFLGENSSLVNLENLIPARPKSTNPFGSAINPTAGGMTSSTSIGQLNNPFAVQQQQQQAMANKPINQMQPQQPFTSSFPFNSSATPLAQPLIVPPTNGGMGMMPPMMNSGFANGMQQQTSLFPSMPPLIPPTNSNFGYSTQPQASNPAASTNPFLMM
jgi:hypothetical protein